MPGTVHFESLVRVYWEIPLPFYNYFNTCMPVALSPVITIMILSFFAVKCSVCKSVSDTYDPYLDVALEIRVWQSYSSASFKSGNNRE